MSTNDQFSVPLTTCFQWILAGLLPVLLLPVCAYTQSGVPPLHSDTPFQPPAYVTIENIYINGNRHTREGIILRELDFYKGDTILLDVLTQRLRNNELNLMNTGLFTDARISFAEWEGATNKVGLNIDLMESWYIFPFPIVELADRNFNVWWSTYNRSLRRLNLGVRFYHTNFTGRNDLLKVVLQFGFTKKYELIYNLPAFNRDKTLGLTTDFLHTREKEIGYTTRNNRLLFHRNDEKVLLQRFRIGGGLLYRRGLDVSHAFQMQLHNNIIDDEVALELNPDFFLEGLTQRYLSLNYRFIADKTDIRPYPMKGHIIRANLTKNGLGLSNDINALDLSASIAKYFQIGRNWSIAMMVKGKTNLIREKQPYYNSRALGYFEDFIRGYEFYVIDGMDYFYHKEAFRYQLFNGEVNWGNYMKLESFRRMPVKFYLVLHNELGYVNNPYYKEGNPLSNHLLWGTGIGLDIVLYYDKILNLEYSRNHLGERGFFLHWTFSF